MGATLSLEREACKADQWPCWCVLFQDSRVLSWLATAYRVQQFSFSFSIDLSSYTWRDKRLFWLCLIQIIMPSESSIVVRQQHKSVCSKRNILAVGNQVGRKELLGFFSFRPVWTPKTNCRAFIFLESLSRDPFHFLCQSSVELAANIATMNSRYRNYVLLKDENSSEANRSTDSRLNRKGSSTVLTALLLSLVLNAFLVVQRLHISGESAATEHSTYGILNCSWNRLYRLTFVQHIWPMILPWHGRQSHHTLGKTKQPQIDSGTISILITVRWHLAILLSRQRDSLLLSDSHGTTRRASTYSMGSIVCIVWYVKAIFLGEFRQWYA